MALELPSILKTMCDMRRQLDGGLKKPIGIGSHQSELHLDPQAGAMSAKNGIGGMGAPGVQLEQMRNMGMNMQLPGHYTSWQNWQLAGNLQPAQMLELRCQMEARMHLALSQREAQAYLQDTVSAMPRIESEAQVQQSGGCVLEESSDVNTENDDIDEHGSKGTDEDNSPELCSSKKRPRSRVKSSTYRGVSRCSKDGRWQARIRIGKAVKYLGRFETQEEAAKAYDRGAILYHADKAVTNFDRTDYEGLFSLSNNHSEVEGDLSWEKLNEYPAKRRKVNTCERDASRKVLDQSSSQEDSELQTAENGNSKLSSSALDAQVFANLGSDDASTTYLNKLTNEALISSNNLFGPNLMALNKLLYLNQQVPNFCDLSLLQIHAKLNNLDTLHSHLGLPGSSFGNQVKLGAPNWVPTSFGYNPYQGYLTDKQLMPNLVEINPTMPTNQAAHVRQSNPRL